MIQQRVLHQVAALSSGEAVALIAFCHTEHNNTTTKSDQFQNEYQYHIISKCQWLWQLQWCTSEQQQQHSTSKCRMFKAD
mmetsp:Transcript_50440/g.64653  ORF Transcript_50440/g.64653 Transcript_50440/m.64653 type:complete len:80 (-) Transcript_50440:211-450(-)